MAHIGALNCGCTASPLDASPTADVKTASRKPYRCDKSGGTVFPLHHFFFPSSTLHKSHGSVLRWAGVPVLFLWLGLVRHSVMFGFLHSSRRNEEQDHPLLNGVRVCFLILKKKEENEWVVDHIPCSRTGGHYFRNDHSNQADSLCMTVGFCSHAWEVFPIFVLHVSVYNIVTP